MSTPPPPPGQEPNRGPGDPGPESSEAARQPGYPPQGAPVGFPPPRPKKSKTGLVLGIAGGAFALGILVTVVVLQPWGGSSAPRDSDEPEDVVEKFFETFDAIESDAFNDPETAVAAVETIRPFICGDDEELLDDIISFFESEEGADSFEDPVPDYAYAMDWSFDGTTTEGDQARVDAAVEYNTIEWDEIDWDDPDLDAGQIEVIRKSDELGVVLEREDGVWKVCDREAWLDL
ncbi:hypothetical protein L0U85_10755 [Glycomyces sp. L485]|uniref:hypothetical protein n=1 Tax=Glycomyces sp. L485 TaxID=2909235 RepID=UPI001F4B6B93|nr:hypothetical protein [Glycomyces sp. L485]MCH7231324.1 hypothetical protein [Glycomyces sp. L485]